MRYARNSAFTLIELLVVISIIGLLASVVLSSLTITRNKAQITSVIMFENNLYQTHGVDALGIWKFDECSGNESYDQSMYLNTASFVGSPTFSTETPSGRGCSINVSPNNYLNAGSNSILYNRPGDVTLAAWVYPRNFSADPYGTVIISGRKSETNQAFSMIINPDSIFSNFSTPSSWQIIQMVASIPKNTWTHIVITRNSADHKIQFYVNGKPVGAQSYAGNATPGDGVLIGSGFNGGQKYFDGLIDDVAIYSSAITASEVNALYAKEAPTHFLAKK